MMKYAALVLSTALLNMPAAQAAEWSLLGDNDIGTFFVEKASIISTRGVLQAKILLNWNQPQELLGHGDKYYTSEISTAYLDCDKRKIGFGSRTMYDKADGRGKVLFSPYLAYSEVKLQDTLPGSTGEQMVKLVCNKRPGR